MLRSEGCRARARIARRIGWPARPVDLHDGGGDAPPPLSVHLDWHLARTPSESRQPRRDEKAHGPRHGPFRTANDRKVRENADTARRPGTDGNTCKSARLALRSSITAGRKLSTSCSTSPRRTQRLPAGGEQHRRKPLLKARQDQAQRFELLQLRPDRLLRHVELAGELGDIERYLGRMGHACCLQQSQPTAPVILVAHLVGPPRRGGCRLQP